MRHPIRATPRLVADNVNQPMPRTRAGKIHLFNNLFTAAGDSVQATVQAGAGPQ